jgi:hypothetical protein
MSDECTETSSVKFPAQGELLALPPGHEVDEACDNPLITKEES